MSTTWQTTNLQSSTKLKIAITNAYTCRNKGDAAIVEAMLQVLRKDLPYAEFTVFSLHPEDDCEFYRALKAEVQPNPIMPRSKAFVLTQFGIWILIWILGAKVSKAFERWVPVPVYRELSESDIHVSCGGAYLNDSWGFSYVVHLFTIMVSKFLHKPIILYPQTIGPFKKRLGRVLARFVLNRADAIFVRDDFSRTYLISVLRVTGPPIYMGADGAFLTQPASRSRIHEILEREELDGSKPLVGITVRRWVFPFAQDARKRYDDFRLTMAKIADYVVESKGATPVFLPMVSIPNKPLEQDDEASRDVIKAMKHRAEAKLLQSSRYSPEEIKGLIGEMNLQIGTRMHSVIFAVSMNVPVIAIAYEPKTFSLMNSLGLDRFVFGIEALNFEEIARCMDSLWRDGSRWVRIAAPRVKSMEQDASEAGSAVASLCKLRASCLA